jgi:hypothetical protein
MRRWPKIAQLVHAQDKVGYINHKLFLSVDISEISIFVIY